jgi:hypothetical protein
MRQQKKEKDKDKEDKWKNGNWRKTIDKHCNVKNNIEEKQK